MTTTLKRYTLIPALLLCCMGSLGLAASPSPHEVESLKEKFQRQFIVGVALGGRVPDDYSDVERQLILRQFSGVTPENCMKMRHLQPREGEFDFRQADAIVAFAEKHGLKVVGHTLLWAKDEQTPAWFFRDGEKPASRERVLARMKTHIQTVVGRYKGRVASWDVVNEAIDEQEAYLRPSQWLSIVGPDFIEKAFVWAHEADPNAVLTCNDFNVEPAKKRAKLLRLIGELREKKIPLGGVGIQGHWEVDKVPFRDLEALLVEMKQQGLKVAVSELDLGVVPRGPWWADGGKRRAEIARTDPLKSGCPAELLDKQARQYADLFRLFVRHADTIDRVTFWDLHDGRSWLNYFPWRRTEHPLLFDRQSRPKPAFRAVLDAQ